MDHWTAWCSACRADMPFGHERTAAHQFAVARRAFADLGTAILAELRRVIRLPRS